jgi:hypothetical protein
MVVQSGTKLAGRYLGTVAAAVRDRAQAHGS